MESTRLNQIVPLGRCARRSPLRVNNVARRLHRPERTIRHWAKVGKIRGFKIDRKSWAFWPEDVDVCQRMFMEDLNA